MVGIRLTVSIHRVWCQKMILTACTRLPFSLLFLLSHHSSLPHRSLHPPRGLQYVPGHMESKFDSLTQQKNPNIFQLGLFFPILMSWLITAPSANAHGESVARGNLGPTVDVGSYSGFGHLMVPYLDCAMALSTLLTQGNMDKLLLVHQRAGKKKSTAPPSY